VSEARRTSEVEVGLDPATAFAVFTEELDYWWLRGPINNWDSARVRAMRCEPGLGGRLLEIYDETGDDVLELARITAWEPGERLGWRSSVDDVSIEVVFEPVPGGTRVRLTASVAPGGKDKGGGSFVRVTPSWFGRWASVRDSIGRHVQETGRLALAVYYAEPARAARWLRDVFGLTLVLELDEGADEAGWIEFRLGDASLMVFDRDASGRGPSVPTHVPWVFVDDLDAHYASVRKAGARIVDEIRQHGYRAYVAEDCEGHQWTFAQARPTMRAVHKVT
jgi:uncharacterized glyoxalase superfamily protein PhnB